MRLKEKIQGQFKHKIRPASQIANSMCTVSTHGASPIAYIECVSMCRCSFSLSSLATVKPFPIDRSSNLIGGIVVELDFYAKPK